VGECHLHFLITPTYLQKLQVYKRESTDPKFGQLLPWKQIKMSIA